MRREEEQALVQQMETLFRPERALCSKNERLFPNKRKLFVREVMLCQRVTALCQWKGTNSSDNQRRLSNKLPLF
jgi:hypothetical protein